MAVACATLLACAHASQATTVRLTLDEAVRIADAQSPALAAARATADAAHAGVTRARSLLLPSITLTGVVTPTQRAPHIVVPEGTITIGGVPLPAISFEARTTGKYLATAELTQSLWTWGRTSRALTAAHAQADAADARAHRAHDDLVRGVRHAFHAAALAEELVRVAVEDSTLRVRLESVASARVRTGDLARIDLVAAQSERAHSAATAVRARSGARVASHALAVALGLRDTTEVAPANAIDALAAAAIVPRDVETLAQDAVAMRADVRAAREEARAAHEGLSAARRANWPTLGLSARVLYQDDRAGHLFDESGRVYTVGIGVSAPLFDGFRTRAGAREAAALALAADNVARAVEQQAAFEVRAAALTLEAATAEIDARRQALALAEDRARIAETAFRTGDITATDVNAAAVARAAARAELAEAQARALDAAADLAHASGQSAR